MLLLYLSLTLQCQEASDHILHNLFHQMTMGMTVKGGIVKWKTQWLAAFSSILMISKMDTTDEGMQKLPFSGISRISIGLLRLP
ncbi:hypothetical protein C5167_044071 [Papaver somniferum]|uniref:Uncharacterized protein n=1 Tax=Papaver somniferum TaxID=3469 RepID=A0A4Y7LAE5_PAPSO|nr:hypothetical protein C5167_044071 [Papaver somniferum]